MNQLYHYTHLRLFGGVDESLFKQSYQNLGFVLMNYFNDYHLNRPMSNEFYQQFETLTSLFLSQEKHFIEKSHTDVVENFFA